MIYRRNGKLLVKNGKLCRSCCGIIPGEDCQYCEAGKTPLKLTISIANTADCDCHYASGESWYPWCKTIGLASIVNNIGKWIATQSSQYPCVWFGFAGLPSGAYIRKWDNSNCSGAPDYEYALTGLGWNIQRNSGDVRIYGYCLYQYGELALWTPVLASITSKCLECSGNWGTNCLNEFVGPDHPTALLNGGTFQIMEGG